MMILIEILLLSLSFVLLSLSLPRHYGQVTNRRKALPKPIIWIIRVVGYSLLISALLFAVNVWGLALGATYWCATLTLVAMLLTLVFTYGFERSPSRSNKPG